MRIGPKTDSDGFYVCGGCGESKMLEDFGIDNRSSTGRKSTCKACCAEYRRKNTLREFERLLDEEVPYLAIIELMQKHPGIYRAFVTKYLHKLEPIIQRIRREEIIKYNKRSVARAEGLDNKKRQVSALKKKRTIAVLRDQGRQLADIEVDDKLAI